MFEVNDNFSIGKGLDLWNRGSVFCLILQVRLRRRRDFFTFNGLLIKTFDFGPLFFFICFTDDAWNESFFGF